MATGACGFFLLQEELPPFSVLSMREASECFAHTTKSEKLYRDSKIQRLKYN